MTPNNNLSILPFYTDIQKQNHRKDYAFGEVFPLFTPDRKILPFQIIRPHRDVNDVMEAKLFSIAGIEVADITESLKNNGLTINRYSTHDVILYPGKLLITTNTPEGQYYLRLSDWAQYYYSEVFTVVRSVEQYLKISYLNLNNIVFDTGSIDFTNNFSFDVYLPTQLGRPDYEFEEQVEKRDGFQFIEKQISEKTYKFNFLAPEFLLDAMRIIRMMDEVTITNKGETYEVDQFLMTPKWQDGGYLAAVEVEFQCNTVVKKLGQSYDTTIVLGDFNADFNNDFDK